MVTNSDRKFPKWNNRCPKCNSQIIWSMPNGSRGSKCYARCARSVFSSVNVNSINEIKICGWEGIGVRQSDGEVRFREKNGEWLRETGFAKVRKNIK